MWYNCLKDLPNDSLCDGNFSNSLWCLRHTMPALDCIDLSSRVEGLCTENLSAEGISRYLPQLTFVHGTGLKIIYPVQHREPQRVANANSNKAKHNCHGTCAWHAPILTPHTAIYPWSSGSGCRYDPYMYCDTNMRSATMALSRTGAVTSYHT